MNSSQTISFIPLGGVGDVTRNMYLYIYQSQILIVDCGLGFADETMLGVDLLLPDIAPLTKLLGQGKKIAGMLLTHGHEDHIGALPFVLPQLPDFPIFATPLTTALANEKLKEFGVRKNVQAVTFEGGDITLGAFSASFIRVTHSVPDTSHIFIKTPVGNFYHGSDFKFDLTPFDGKKAEFQKIIQKAGDGVICLMSDALGAERVGHTPSEMQLSESFEHVMRECQGKCIITTYSSNISRLNQAIEAAKQFGRKVCFVGRSLMNAKTIAQDLKLMKLDPRMEIAVDSVKNYKDNNLLLIVAGSQGQENSAMTRIANGEHKDIRLSKGDVVIFSSDPIPGNEVAINELIDTIAKKGARVVYSALSDKFHVSGHGSSQELMLLMNLVKPKAVLPIGATYRQMVAYKNLATMQGFTDQNILLIEDGQEIIFSQTGGALGQKLEVRNVYVDETSGEEVESYVLRDRLKISQDGVVIIITEVDSSKGTLMGEPDIIVRGFSKTEIDDIQKQLTNDIKNTLVPQKERVKNWVYIRKRIGEISERRIFGKLHRRPLILPVVIEV